MLYTEEVKQTVRAIKSGVRGLIIDVVEYNDMDGNYLAFVLYRDNFKELNREEQLKAADKVREIINTLRHAGIPSYLSVLATAPKYTKSEDC